MGSTTSHGFPYPTGTDRLADGDNAIQSLAQYTDDYFVSQAALVMPRCRVNYANAGTSVAHNTTTTLPMTGGAVAYDTNAMADLAGGLIRIKTAGWYEVTIRICFASNATGYRGALVYKNGISVVALDDYRNAITGTVTISTVSSEPMLFAVNDYVMSRVIHQAGAALMCGVVANSQPSFLAVHWRSAQ